MAVHITSVMRVMSCLACWSGSWDEEVCLAKHRCPRMAIDAFVAVFCDELDVLLRGYQLAVQKRP